MTLAIGARVRPWRGNPRLVSVLSLAVAAFSIACANVDGTTDGTADGVEPETVAETDQAVVLPYSDPADANQAWYALVKDNFTVELPNWRVHNNGCIGTCNVYLHVGIGTEGGATDRAYDLAETYRGPDARDYDWSAAGLAFTVERKAGACFSVWMSAKNSGDISAVFPRYCWNAGTRNWEPSGNGALAIGTAQNIHDRFRADFSFTYNFRLRWDSTTMDGVIEGNQNSPADGNDWHHLPQISLWNNPSSVTVRMENPSGGGDADLYTSSIAQPTLDSYECRPYYGPGAVEECAYANRQSIWASVHNYTTAMAGYHLTITPTY